MNKRDSKRRWKARARLGKPIPREAIEEYSLNRWFVFAWKPLVDYGVVLMWWTLGGRHRLGRHFLYYDKDWNRT